ncbi:MAG: glycosyltransferase family 2 protein [Noviherbaspirillum sp.]
MSSLGGRLAVVVLTHNRAPELRRTLAAMLALPEKPEIVVVDNASSDGTAAMLARDFPEAKLVALERNIGAAGRNIGVQQVTTPYVAFCDDDTCWSPGALTTAAALLDQYPRVAVLCARVLVGRDMREDPTCAVMAESPLPAEDLPGPSLLGFLAGACVMRRQAFLDARGYEPNFFIGGEEALLSLDLVSAGWRIVYAPCLTVHHHPSANRDGNARRLLLLRNGIWIAWMRLPLACAARETARLCRQAHQGRILGATLATAVCGLPWILKKRRVISDEIAGFYRMVRR